MLHRLTRRCLPLLLLLSTFGTPTLAITGTSTPAQHSNASASSETPSELKLESKTVAAAPRASLVLDPVEESDGREEVFIDSTSKRGTSSSSTWWQGLAGLLAVVLSALALSERRQ